MVVLVLSSNHMTFLVQLVASGLKNDRPFWLNLLVVILLKIFWFWKQFNIFQRGLVSIFLVKISLRSRVTKRQTNLWQYNGTPIRRFHAGVESILFTMWQRLMHSMGQCLFSMSSQWFSHCLTKCPVLSGWSSFFRVDLVVGSVEPHNFQQGSNNLSTPLAWRLIFILQLHTPFLIMPIWFVTRKPWIQKFLGKQVMTGFFAVTFGMIHGYPALPHGLRNWPWLVPLVNRGVVHPPLPDCTERMGSCSFGPSYRVRFFRPRCIAIEQVPGFSHHPHKFWVLKALLFCGYRMAWSKVVDLQDHSPTSRPRWLGVAVRIHDQFPEVAFNPWKKQQRVTPEEVEAIMSFTPEQLLPLHVSESAYDIASDPCYYKGPPIKVFVGQTVIGTRVYGDHQCLPTFMAMYGSQHCFDSEYLKKHGFFGHFKQDPQCPRNIRYWHPIEIALIHGITSPCFLEDLMAFSWMVLGNLISQPHALLVLTDVCNRMRGQEIAIDSVIADFQHHRFHASDIDPLCIRDGTLWLSKSEHPLRAFEFRDPVFHLNIAQLLEHVCINMLNFNVGPPKMVL